MKAETPLLGHQKNQPQPRSKGAPPDPDSVGNSTRVCTTLVVASEIHQSYLCALGIWTCFAIFSFCWIASGSSNAKILIVVSIMLCLIELVWMFITVTRDPGIVRKASAPVPSDSDRLTGRDVTFRSIRGLAVPMPYCYTCELIREPRTSHCQFCNNCVRRFDHHCGFIGCCVGEGNFGHWYWFIVVTTVFAWFHVVSAMFFVTHYWKIQPLWVCLAMCVVIGGGSYIGVNTTIMTWRYSVLVSRGYTYREELKRLQLKAPDMAFNPFDNGCRSNFCEMVCYSAPPSAPPSTAQSCSA